MKKLINDPSGLVREMLEGAARQAPGTALLGDEHVLVRSDLPAAERRPVAVISGGGSGHEPAHAGYVGAGMLSAAVCGEVFTSPSTDAVLAAIRATAGPNGALLIVKNYTGDRLNFGRPPSWPAPRASRWRSPSSPTTCRCAGTRRANVGGASPAPCWCTRSRARPRPWGCRWRRSPPRARRPRSSARWAWPWAAARCRVRRNPASRWPTTRSSWAWASMARRASSAAPCCRPTS